MGRSKAKSHSLKAECVETARLYVPQILISAQDSARKSNAGKISVGGDRNSCGGRSGEHFCSGCINIGSY